MYSSVQNLPTCDDNTCTASLCLASLRSIPLTDKMASPTNSPPDRCAGMFGWISDINIGTPCSRPPFNCNVQTYHLMATHTHIHRPHDTCQKTRRKPMNQSLTHLLTHLKKKDGTDHTHSHTPAKWSMVRAELTCKE